jgi:acyl-CoA dehydrogenase
MDFTIPAEIQEEEKRFRAFLDEEMMPHLGTWYRDGEVPRAFHERICQGGWIGFEMKDGRLAKRLALREATLGEIYGRLSPGVAVATLAHADLGIMALWLWGSDELKKRYADAALSGKTLMCLGNTESGAGSDVANIAMRAEKVDGGWLLNGTKAYVTGGLISDMAVVTAISDPDADRNKRLSMYLVDLKTDGVTRKKLNKQVWIPSDLTRIQLHNTFVPDDHLMGERGRGRSSRSSPTAGSLSAASVSERRSAPLKPPWTMPKNAWSWESGSWTTRPRRLRWPISMRGWKRHA